MADSVSADPSQRFRLILDTFPGRGSLTCSRGSRAVTTSLEDFIDGRCVDWLEQVTDADTATELIAACGRLAPPPGASPFINGHVHCGCVRREQYRRKRGNAAALARLPSALHGASGDPVEVRSGHEARFADERGPTKPLMAGSSGRENR